MIETLIVRNKSVQRHFDVVKVNFETGDYEVLLSNTNLNSCQEFIESQTESIGE